MKPRDFEPVPPFEIAGRPFINEIADFAMLDEPRQPSEKAEASKFTDFVKANPTATYDEVATAIHVAKGRVKNIGKKAGWAKTGRNWVKNEP